MGRNIIKKQYALESLPDTPLTKNDGGLYAILPYSRLVKNHAVFKVGLADSFRQRFEQYHTAYPEGFWFKDLLINPDEEQENFYYKDKNDRNKRKFAKKHYLGEIERFIHSDIIDHGGKRLYSTTRVKKSVDDNGVIKGETEWFYATPEQIENSFEDAFKIYGGRRYTGSLNHINRIAAREKAKATYTAEINYKVYNHK